MYNMVMANFKRKSNYHRSRSCGLCKPHKRLGNSSARTKAKYRASWYTILVLVHPTSLPSGSHQAFRHPPTTDTARDQSVSSDLHRLWKALS